jgi:hypothetical protein
MEHVKAYEVQRAITYKCELHGDTLNKAKCEITFRNKKLKCLETKLTSLKQTTGILDT